MKRVVLSGPSNSVGFGEHQTRDAMIVHGNMRDAVRGETVFKGFASEETVGLLSGGNKFDGPLDLLSILPFVG